MRVVINSKFGGFCISIAAAEFMAKRGNKIAKAELDEFQETGKRKRIMIRFFATLIVLFIALKLTGVIDWSWLWVLAPIWIPGGFVLLIIGAVILFYILKG